MFIYTSVKYMLILLLCNRYKCNYKCKIVTKFTIFRDNMDYLSAGYC